MKYDKIYMNSLLLEGGVEMDNTNALNRVFSKKTISELLSSGKSDILNSTFKKYLSEEEGPELYSNKLKIQKLYMVLEKQYRNEYFYKNTLFNKLLLGKHSLNTTTALAELWVNKSKADFVLFNGKAVVYEIKTALDTLDRLDSQITDYYKLFGYVEIVIDEKHASNVLEIYKNHPVGIHTLTKRNTLSRIKKAEENVHELNYETMYKALRKNERMNVLFSYYKEMPEFNSFEEFEKNFELFTKIPKNVVHTLTIEQLKQRGNIIKSNLDLFKEVPYELKALVYFSFLSTRKYSEFELKLEE